MARKNAIAAQQEQAEVVSDVPASAENQPEAKGPECETSGHDETENNGTNTADANEDNRTGHSTETLSKALVICAYHGTESLIKDAWTKYCDMPFKLVSTDESTDIRDIVESCIADNEIYDEFVLVPANAIPCSKISSAELAVPVVYIDSQQERHYYYRLPILFTKQQLVDYLAADDSAGELFVKGYVEQYCTRPVAVGYNFGNYVAPVLRPDPCDNKVIEAFLKRKFVVANPQGFAAIQHLIRDFLLK